MNFIRRFFRTTPSRTQDEIIRDADLENAQLIAICELNLVGQRNGPREMQGAIALKGNQLIFAPFDKSLAILHIPVATLGIVRPTSDELRFTTNERLSMKAEYFKIDRSSSKVQAQALVRWRNEISIQFYEKLVQLGASDIERKQLTNG